MSHPNKDSYSNFVESLALFNKSPDVLIKRIKIAFKRSGINGELPKVEFKNHHESHVASVFSHPCRNLR